ncbi:MAG: MFS transporter [Chloroflexi bacterium]|nr:MFS transporter [Chloroflexota bacterium]
MSSLSDNTATAAPAKRRGVYNGWPIAVTASLATGLTIGTVNYAFGVFIDPLEDHFGWSRTQINTALTFGVAAALFSPLIGRLLDRFGSRPVMAGSLLLVGAGFFTIAGMTALWQFYAGSLLLYLGLPGAMIMPTGRLISVWFPGMRGRMMGFVLAGENIGGLAMVSLATLVVGASGWRTGYVVFGVILLLIIVPAIVFVRDSQSDIDAARGKRWTPALSENDAAGTSVGYALSDVLRMRSYYLLAAGHAIPMLSFAGFLSQLIPHLETEGISSGAAASGVMVLAGFGILSKLTFGPLSEKITARWAMSICLSIQSLGLLLLLAAGGSYAVWFAIAFIGMGFGAIGALVPLTVAEAYGMRHFGSILGFTSMLGVIPMISGPLIAGVVFDAYGAYDVAFVIMSVAYGLGALGMALASRPPVPGMSTQS